LAFFAFLLASFEDKTNYLCTDALHIQYVYCIILWFAEVCSNSFHIALDKECTRILLFTMKTCNLDMKSRLLSTANYPQQPDWQQSCFEHLLVKVSLKRLKITCSVLVISCFARCYHNSSILDLRQVFY